MKEKFIKVHRVTSPYKKFIDFAIGYSANNRKFCIYCAMTNSCTADCPKKLK